MITREYKCPTHGIVEHQCRMTDTNIDFCPVEGCKERVNRHYEPTANSWKCSGHAGKGFATTGKQTI